MKLSEKLLKKLADDVPAGRQLVTVADESPTGWKGALTIDRADLVGCIIWELILQHPSAPRRDAAGLRCESERIAESVHGLLEPLKLLEVDEVRLEALVRSDGPTTRGQDVFYYEVKLQADNTIALRRFHASTAAGSKREQVAFTLTYESVGRVVDDLTA